MGYISYNHVSFEKFSDGLVEICGERHEVAGCMARFTQLLIMHGADAWNVDGGYMVQLGDFRLLFKAGAISFLTDCVDMKEIENSYEYGVFRGASEALEVKVDGCPG